MCIRDRCLVGADGATLTLRSLHTDYESLYATAPNHMDDLSALETAVGEVQSSVDESRVEIDKINNTTEGAGLRIHDIQNDVVRPWVLEFAEATFISKGSDTNPVRAGFDLSDNGYGAIASPGTERIQVRGGVYNLSLIHISEPTRPY